MNRSVSSELSNVRFDDVIEYKLPEREFIIKALKSKVASVNRSKIDWEALADLATGMSYADIARACEGAIKAVIIGDRQHLTQQDLIDTLSHQRGEEIAAIIERTIDATARGAWMEYAQRLTPEMKLGELRDCLWADTDEQRRCGSHREEARRQSRRSSHRAPT